MTPLRHALRHALMDDTARLKRLEGRAVDRSSSRRTIYRSTPRSFIRCPPSPLEVDATRLLSRGRSRRAGRPLPHVASGSRAGKTAAKAREPEATLRTMTPDAEVASDYWHAGPSLCGHPVAFLRAELERRGVVTCAEANGTPDGRLLTVAGLVTLEDETGVANVIVWPRLNQRNAGPLRHLGFSPRGRFLAPHVCAQGGWIQTVCASSPQFSQRSHPLRVSRRYAFRAAAEDRRLTKAMKETSRTRPRAITSDITMGSLQVAPPMLHF